LNRNVSSSDATVGESVDFEVLEDVKIGETLVIPRGGTAIATVTTAQSKRRMARGGKLDINIDYVRLVNDDKVALRAVKEAKGGGHVGAMTGAIVATSLVFFPAAPFFLFMHGKDITVPKGTPITAYVEGDIVLDPARLASKSGALQSPASAAAPLSGVVPPTPESVPPPSGPPSQATPTSTPPPSSHPIPGDIHDPPRPPAPATAHSSAKPMTNEDVIALKTAGFTDEFIIAKIKGSPANYRLDTEDVIALKKANLSEAVIQAMIAALSSSPRPLPAPSAAAGPAPSTKTPMPSNTPPPAASQAAVARAAQQPEKSAGGSSEASSKGIFTKLKGAFSSSSDDHKAPTLAAERTAPAQFALTSVTVLSKPAGAAIFVDNYPAGRTPAVVKLVPGKYKLTLKAEGFPDYSQQITVEPGQVSSFGVALDGSK
jgi:hypothetical protein